ncbi:MAG TPA: ABC transporter ATP-binding protein, partial [Beijerinckiaceae bacterium]|nr:ABC transporter ATP-binding protein [Beijerinckiaceae bacterium]
MAPPPILALEKLTIHVRADGGRRLKIVEGIDFEIMPGRFFALVGESGSGKTMIARAIMRLLPDELVDISGAITFDGEDLVQMPERKLRRLRNARIGMIFQEPMSSLNPLMTVGRQITEAIDAHARIGPSEKRRRVLDLLSEVQFSDPELVMRQYPHELSGGMRQRIVIAMALVNAPSLLIADEPTTALDVTIQKQVLDLIAEVARGRGLAILLITHDLSLVRQYADEVGVLYGGVMMERGSASEVIENPMHPYTAALLSCVPRRRTGRTRQEGIEGAVPSVTDWRPGCRFVERCRRAGEMCRADPIAWRNAH